MISNADVFLAIAEEALARSKELERTQVKPRDDGGRVITYDPDRNSFKQSLIATVFAAMYLEAMLYIVGRQRLGPLEYDKIEKRSYERKLQALGISDPAVLASCKHLRESRNDLVHEKALEPHELEGSTYRMAQKEAALAVALVKSVVALLEGASDFSGSGHAVGGIAADPRG